MLKNPGKLFITINIIILCIIFNAYASDQRPFNIDAKSAVLLDGNTGEILFSQNANELIPPASFTKLITLYIVFDALKNNTISLDDQVTVSKNAWQTEGSKMFIEVNKRVSLEDLIKGIAVVSGNDSCVAIAEHLQGDINPFIISMNKKVKELGMNNSHFSSSNGLPAPDQYTTALDMALLASKYIKKFPEAIKYHSLKEFTYNGIKQPNRNRLLWVDSDVDGLKTGHTEKAEYHLLATAKKNDMRLISVVMGCKSESVREAEAYRLLNYGFKNFTNIRLFNYNQELLKSRIWKGQTKEIPLAASGTGMFTVKKILSKKAAYRVEPVFPIIAPIEQGTKLGKVIIFDKESKIIIREIPLVAAASVKKGSFIRTGIDTFRLAMHNNPLKIWGYIGAGIIIGVIFLMIILKRKKRR